MSTPIITSPEALRDLRKSVYAEIEVDRVYEAAAQADHDMERLAELDAHERGKWDSLMHLLELH